jgi:hypothetical protein
MPDQDSPLWAVGDAWKISEKTGKVYINLERITDEHLGRTMEDELNKEKKTPVEYMSYFFVPSSMERDGKLTFLVYAFTNNDEAERHASFKPTQQQTFKAQPKTGSFGSYKTSNKTGTSSYNTTAAAVAKPPVEKSVTSFRQLQPVRWDDLNLIDTLNNAGFTFLTTEYAGDKVFFKNEEGQWCYWMGKPFNAKVSEQ